MHGKGYHYRESGLDNVYIHGVDVVTDDAGEETFNIPNVMELHREIARGLVTQLYGLSGAEVRFLRTEIGITQAQLARYVNKDGQTVGRWERGETPVDSNAEIMIRLLAAEKLGLLPLGVPMETLAMRCISSTENAPINVCYENSGYKLAA